MSKSPMPTARKGRGKNKPKLITESRKLVSGSEAALMLGCHRQTIKRLEECRGGPLKAIRLTPNARVVYYRIDQINALAEGATSNA